MPDLHLFQIAQFLLHHLSWKSAFFWARWNNPTIFFSKEDEEKLTQALTLHMCGDQGVIFILGQGQAVKAVSFSAV